MGLLPSLLDLARHEYPDATDAQRVRQIAANTIRELGIVAPPVDVRMVASVLGIHSVIVDQDLEAAGCLISHDGRFDIRVRASDPPTRRRFTVCHECSHTFFPGFARQTRYRCFPSEQPGRRPNIEVLCDIAAGELLLPTDLFFHDAGQTGFSITGLEDLATRYGASLEATARQLVATWQREPAAMLVFTRRQKPSEAGTSAPPRLRLDYAYTSGSWPYFLPHKSADPDDVFDRTLEGAASIHSATVKGICTDPVRAEVHTRAYPITIDGVTQQRVMALVRRAGR